MPCIQPSSQPSCHLMKPCGFPQAILSKRSATCDVPPCEPRGPAMARGQPCGYHTRSQKKTKICLHLARTQEEAGFHRRPSVAHEMPATAIHTGNTNHVHNLTYRQTIREAQVTGHRNEPLVHMPNHDSDKLSHLQHCDITHSGEPEHQLQPVGISPWPSAVHGSCCGAPVHRGRPNSTNR